jgi:hypothetical protein
MAFTHLDGILRDFYFVVVENQPPFGVKLWKVSDESLFEGELQWKAAIETYKKCLDEGLWPGYNNDLIEEI